MTEAIGVHVTVSAINDHVIFPLINCQMHFSFSLETIGNNEYRDVGFSCCHFNTDAALNAVIVLPIIEA
jgi:hypothetical protein